jgi:arylsulfatase A-like enzyme
MPRSLSFLLTSALAAALCGLGDGFLVLVRAGEPVPFSVLSPVLLACVGLYAVPALLCGLLEMLVVSSAYAVLDVPALHAGLRSRLRDPEADRRLAGLVLAVAAAVGLHCALVYLFGRFYAVEMANKRNTALTTAMFAAAALPVAALSLLPAYRLLRLAAVGLPRPRTVCALGLLLFAALAGVVLAVLSVDWRIINFGAAKALVSFLALQLLLLLLGRSEPLWLAQPRWLKGLVIGSAALSLLVCTGFTFTRFGAEPRSRALLAEETAGAKALLAGFRRLGDRDRDGYSALLGGGDCDDQNAQVHPGAEEIPGDEIDQDCDGTDFTFSPAAGGERVKSVPSDPSPAANPPAESAQALPRWDGSWLIITIDTLRADRVTPQITPHLAALAERGIAFTAAYAQAPNTPRSFPSILTSRLPSQVHYVNKTWNFSPVTGKDPTLFTALAEAGYRNIGIFSHFYMEERIGLARGFAEWSNAEARNLHDSNSDIAAPRITKRVVERIRRLGRAPGRFVLWTHLFDPHSTYMDHPEFPVAGKGVRHLAARYNAEVAFTDRHVGQILQALTDAGLSERTAVLVFSDHGESFGEHRLGGEPLYFHGETLYDEVLKVPVILSVPGLAPARIADPVMLMDLAPTLLELSQVPVPATFRGRSLLPRISGAPLPPRPIYAEMLPATSWQHHERVVISGGYKLYAKFTDNTYELYHLAEDPTEQRNLAASLPDQVRALRRLLSTPHSGAQLR